MDASKKTHNEQDKQKKVVLTGITPSGIAHLGNYIGAIKPALEMAKNDAYNAYFLLPIITH